MKKTIMMTVLVLLLTVFSGCASSSSNVLTIATNSGFVPYEMTNTNNELEGFDIDFGNALAKELGYEKAEWKDMDFDAIIPQLTSSSVDIAIAGMSPDPARLETSKYSVNYFVDNAYYILTLKDSGITSRKDLAGKIIGVQTGVTQEKVANELAAELGATVDSRKDLSSIVQEILLGRIDVMIMEKTTVPSFAKEYPDKLTTFELDGITQDQINEGGRVVYMPKNSDLEAKINAAIEKLQADGTIDAIAAKWFK